MKRGRAPGREKGVRGVGHVLGASVLAFFVLCGSRAAAAPIPLDLLWNGAAACSSRGEVLIEVSRMLEGTRTVPVPVVAWVDVAGREGGLWLARLSLHARGGNSERQLEATNCADITSALRSNDGGFRCARTP